MKLISAVLILLAAQAGQAATVRSAARFDLIQAQPVADVGQALTLELAERLSIQKISWVGYEKQMYCPGDAYDRDADGDQYCAVEELTSWIPRVEIAFTHDFTLKAASDSATEIQKKDASGTWAVNASLCVKDFENYRVFGAEAPQNGPAELVLDVRACAVSFSFSENFYLENPRLLKGNRATLGLSRLSTARFAADEVLTLERNRAQALKSDVSLAVQPRGDNQYPELTISGFVGMSYQAPYVPLFGRGGFLPIRLSTVD